MANLFIGFPVPRAKIAEMIEGAAPPLEHIANHLPGGSDPLILPGDISAGQIVQWNGTKFIGIAEPTGGLARRYDDTDLFFYTNFESLDGFDVYTSAGASADVNEDKLWLQTGSTINHLARVRKRHNIQYLLASWNNPRKFKVTAWFYASTNNVGLIYIGTGGSSGLRHVTFLLEDGILKGSVHNGSSQTTVNLDDWGAGAYGRTKNLEAIFTPGSKAEFYIDGYKIDEITTGLPSGATDADYFLYASVKNTDGTNHLWLRINQFECTQAL